jgi:GntR family transcriptional regulator
VSSRPTRVEEARGRLLAGLTGGTFLAGTKLPSEQELAQRFDVSRLTIREAVGSLVEAGYLTRRQGSGTYVNVALPRRHALDTTVSYTAMIVEAGMRAGEVLLNRKVVSANEELAKRLQVDPGDALVRLERIRTADERPVIYSVDHIPSTLVDGVSPDRFESSLYRLFEEQGIGVRSASARLKPVIAGARVARLLGITKGSPLLYIDEDDHDAAGRAVMVSAEWHVPDIFEMHVNRRIVPMGSQ